MNQEGRKWGERRKKKKSQQSDDCNYYYYNHAGGVESAVRSCCSIQCLPVLKKSSSEKKGRELKRKKNGMHPE